MAAKKKATKKAKRTTQRTPNKRAGISVRMMAKGAKKAGVKGAAGGVDV